MWSNAMWHTSHGHGHGSHLAMLTVFFVKMVFFDQKIYNLVFKMGQKGQKAVPEVTDGNHGGLGRG